MITRAFTIYDRKTFIYSAPFFAVADGAAVRSFQEAANDLNTNIGRHPADFQLYFVGLWDDQKATMLPEVPVHITDALPLVAPHSPLFEDARTETHRPGPNGRHPHGHAGSEG